MKKMLLTLTVFLVLLFAVQAYALPVNPSPTLLNPDDGAQLFNHCNCASSTEYFDITENLTIISYDSEFGFFFKDTPNSLIPIFGKEDQKSLSGKRPSAKIDFAHGKVVDTDGVDTAVGTVQSTFSANNPDAIGFYFKATPQQPFVIGLPSLLVFTLASRNAGGDDVAATFPLISNPAAYLIGFETPDSFPVPNLTVAFEFVNGITPYPVPEPESSILLGIGLLMVGVFTLSPFLRAKLR